MTDTTTTAQPATAATGTRQRTTRPTVSVRPFAVGAVNAATIAGATIAAAGGGVALAAAGAGMAVAATAAGARKTSKAKADRADRRSSRAASQAAGRASRSSAATPGGRAPGSKPSPHPRAASAARPTARPAAASRTTPGTAAGRKPTPGGGSKPSAGGSLFGKSTPTGGRHRPGSPNGSTSGFRKTGSTTGSTGRRSALTPDRVAKARQKIAARRKPGPRIGDAVHNATRPRHDGKHPTPGQAWRAARQNVTGTDPKKRGPVRTALAGITAAGLAAGKVAWDNRQRRRKAEAARAAKNARVAARRAVARPAVAGTVRTTTASTPDPIRPATSTAAVAKPAPITRPAANRPATATTGGTHMSRQLLALSEDFLAAAARNQPEGMLQVVAEAKLMPQIMENLATAMKLRYDQAMEQPLHPVIKDMYAAIHQGQLAVVTAADEVGPTMERIHKDELDRLRNPMMRGDESMWDVTKNRGAA